MEMTVEIPRGTEIDVEIDVTDFIDAYGDDEAILEEIAGRNTQKWILDTLEIEVAGELSLNDIFNGIDKLESVDKALVLWHLLKDN